MVPINYLAVLIAAVANMLLGWLWFGPLFGKQWAKLSGISEQQMQAAMQKGMGQSYIIMFVGSFLMAWVLDHALIFADTYLIMNGLSSGIMVGFMSWLGFVAPVTVGSVLWEGKSWNYWALTFSYYLVGLMLMGVILAAWM